MQQTLPYQPSVNIEQMDHAALGGASKTSRLPFCSPEYPPASARVKCVSSATMHTRSLLLLVALFHLALSDESEDDDDRWIVPTEPGPSNNFGANLVWSEGSTATLEWTSTLSHYVIDLYQQGLDPPSGSRVDTVFTTSDGSGSNQLKWAVQTYDSNTTFSPVYFFWLNPSAQGKTSHYFNITDASSSSSASSASSTSIGAVVAEGTRTKETSASKASTSDTSSASIPSSASSTTSATTTTTTPTPTSSQTTASSSDPPPTNTATPSDPAPAAGGTTTDQTSFRVGLGVGLGLGIPLFLLIGAWVSLRLWHQWRLGFQKQNSSVSLAEINDTKHNPYRYATNEEASYYQQHRDYRHEMSSSEPQRYEISGMGRKPSELPA